jgi:hypothetical protein
MFLDDGGLLLGSGGVSFGVSSFGSVARQRSNNEVLRSSVGSIPRQLPTGSNGVVFSLGSVLHNVLTGSGVNPPSYPLGTWGLFLRG